VKAHKLAKVLLTFPEDAQVVITVTECGHDDIHRIGIETNEPHYMELLVIHPWDGTAFIPEMKGMYNDGIYREQERQVIDLDELLEKGDLDAVRTSNAG
jgi:hypothetical protein